MIELKKKKNFFFYYILLIILIFFTFILNYKGLKTKIDNELTLLLKKPYIAFELVDETNISYLKKLFRAIFEFELQKYPTLHININFKNFEKILADRERALSLYDGEEFLADKKKVNGEVIFENKKYQAKIRLKGDRADHWSDTSRMSLDISLKNGHSINNMQRFSITKHASRNFPINNLANIYLSKAGIKTSKYFTYKINVNGNDWGLMLAEEQFSPSYFENRKIKETTIFKLSDSDDVAIATKLASEKYPTIYDGLLSITRFQRNNLSVYGKKFDYENVSQNLINDNIEPSDFEYSKQIFSIINSFAYLTDETINFNKKKVSLKKRLVELLDLKELAYLIAFNSILKDSHSTQLINLRFYYNPFLNKIELIPTDFSGSMYANNYSKYINLNDFFEFLKKENEFFKILFDEKDFIKYFFEAINFYKKNIDNFKINIDEICNNSFECKKSIKLSNINQNIILFENKKSEIINFFKDKNRYLANQENFIQEDILRSIEIFKKDSNLKTNLINETEDFLYARYFNDNKLILQNRNMFEILIDKINLNDFNRTKCQIELNYKLRPGEFFEKNLNHKIKQECKFDRVNFVINVPQKKNSTINSKNFIVEDAIFQDDKFLLSNNVKLDKSIFNETDAEYIIEKGDYVIKEPIIIDNNKNLVIKAGVNLFFKNNSYIFLKNSDLIVSGNKDEKINFYSEDKETWNGIYVINSKDSKINWANFSNGKNFNSKKYFINLTGFINFYNSKIEMSNINISNIIAEDALNIIYSNFELKNIKIDNVNSDAIDFDFSEGKITNSSFSKIKGDALDTSGSKIIFEKIKIFNANDKGFSIGENSKANIFDSIVESSGYGIAVKDGSEVLSKNNEFKNNNIDIAAYTKKPYFEKEAKVYIKESVNKNLILKSEKPNVIIEN